MSTRVSVVSRVGRSTSTRARVRVSGVGTSVSTRLAYCAHCSYFFREKVVRGLAELFFLVFLEAAENKNKTRLCDSRLVKTVQSVHEGGTVFLSGPSAVCPPVEK